MNKVWVREQGLEVFDQKGGVIETPVAYTWSCTRSRFRDSYHCRFQNLGADALSVHVGFEVLKGDMCPFIVPKG